MHPSRRCCFVALVIGATLTGARPHALGVVAPDADVSVNVLVRTTAGYVSQYESDFSYLLADETTVQRVTDAAGRETDTRRTAGEFFTTYVSDVRHWIAVHDIAEVDGRSVPDRDDLAALLRKSSVVDVAKQLIARNARFNIGTVVRNFNEPLLPLLVFNTVYRDSFSFSRAPSAEPAPGMATLAFREHGPGTLVRDKDGNDVPSRGDFDIDVTTGRVERTHLTLHDGPVTADIVTRYTEDARLGVWVPSTFTERYVLDRRGQHETTTCETTFTNYRRFETTSRVVP